MKELVIEGCFDLFHADHRSFIERCIQEFSRIHGQISIVRVRVMGNEWEHRKGPFRPFMDVKERIAAIREYLSGYDVSVTEASLASFEYEDRSEFESEFRDAIIAISKDNVPKIQLPDERYLIIDPLNYFHTSDIEKILFHTRDNSHCSVRKVGALLVRDGLVIGQASNTCTCGDDVSSCAGCAAFINGNIAKSRSLGCGGLHAEESVLANIDLAENNDKVILITTVAPCVSCANKIIEFGIKQVIYIEEWNRLSEDKKSWFTEDSGVKLLRDKGAKVRKAGI